MRKVNYGTKLNKKVLTAGIIEEEVKNPAPMVGMHPISSSALLIHDKKKITI